MYVVQKQYLIIIAFITNKEFNIMGRNHTKTEIDHKLQEL